MPARADASSERSRARSSSGARALERLELQHHAGQRLADLVVQLARHPPALLLLGVERAARAVAALALEPVEHVVERVAELGDLGHLALELDPLPGASGSTRRISAVRRSSGPNTRRSASRLTARTTATPTAEHDHLADVDALADRRGGDGEHGDGGDEHRRVDRDDAPEQRHAPMMPKRPRADHGQRSPTDRVPRHERPDLPRAPRRRRPRRAARPAPRPRRRRARPARRSATCSTRSGGCTWPRRARR